MESGGGLENVKFDTRSGIIRVIVYFALFAGAGSGIHTYNTAGQAQQIQVTGRDLDAIKSEIGLLQERCSNLRSIVESNSKSLPHSTERAQIEENEKRIRAMEIQIIRLQTRAGMAYREEGL